MISSSLLVDMEIRAAEIRKRGPNVPPASLPAPAAIKRSRFSQVDDEKAAELAKGKRSKNTSCSTAWTVNVFDAWIKERRARESDSAQVPEGFLTRPETDISQLNRWLSRSVAEDRNKDGKPYSPVSVQSLLSGILRHMRELSVDTPNFMDKGDRRFHELHGVVIDFCVYFEFCVYFNMFCYHENVFTMCFDVNMRMFLQLHYMGTTSRDCMTFTVLDVATV